MKKLLLLALLAFASSAPRAPAQAWLYQGHELAPLAVQYADVAAWQRSSHRALQMSIPPRNAIERSTTTSFWW